MAKSETKQSCFIIMPITTPIDLVERYKDDTDHFAHVLEHLFVPALENAGFDPVPPKSTGSPVIQAEIIKQLSSCELVLCDMSILNPNVFFEFGIRIALDKPVALVVDDKTGPIPFDTSMLNFHTYDSSLAPWTLEEQQRKLETHIQAAYKKSKGRNDLWKYFGITQTGTFKPEEAELGDKIDLIMKRLAGIEMGQKISEMATIRPSDAPTHLKPMAVYPRMLEEAERLRNMLWLKTRLEDRYKDQIGSSEKPKVERDKSQEPDSENG